MRILVRAALAALFAGALGIAAAGPAMVGLAGEPAGGGRPANAIIIVITPIT